MAKTPTDERKRPARRAAPGAGKGANQQMRWSPRGAHRMLKVRTAVANGTLAEDHAAAERWARRPFRRAA